MRNNLTHFKPVFWYHFLLLSVILINSGHLYSQSYPLPVLPDTSMLGKYTSRTMNLLHQSTPDNRNDVKILVYGQSISAQEWWLEVKRTVESRFPYAHIIMENKSIGGFSTQYLYKTVEMDVSSFYPDLIILHVYGNNNQYETVLRIIRSRTTAEIAIMTDHYIGEHKWSDSMSYYILPSLADKYKCDIINIRDPWKEYLKANDFKPSELLTDGTHLNDHGNFLMAELVKPVFYYKSSIPCDPLNLLTTYRNGVDFNFSGDTITLPFHGNRVDLVYETSGFKSTDSAKILLDDKAPSSFQGSYFITRPYNENGDTWPWELPAMIRINHSAPWITEDWSCIFTKAKPPYLDFRFKIYGSLTGNDGHGRASSDFISRSGKVIINKNDAESGGDWHLNRSYRVLKTIVNKGDTVKWKSYTISTDTYPPAQGSNQSHENSITLFQGVPNSEHILKIVRSGEHLPPILEIRVYKPGWSD